MTFNEILTILRNSDIDEKVKFTHPDLVGYFVKGDLGELFYYISDGEIMADINFFLSDFDREDWEIIP